MPIVIANGKKVESDAIPCSLEAFLLDQGLLPKSVVVELNGQAIAPSAFQDHPIQDGDSMEIVNIVAGG